MDISFGIHTDTIRVVIFKKNIGSIVAFAEIHFVNDAKKVIFKVKGFTIKLKQFKRANEPMLCVDFPAYPSKRGYMKSFILEDIEHWKFFNKAILNAYAQESGGVDASELKDYEDVKPEKI